MSMTAGEVQPITVRPEINADGENRTRKAKATRPSSVRVYQFHHIRLVAIPHSVDDRSLAITLHDCIHQNNVRLAALGTSKSRR